jgi:peptidoglycan/xylan/chitin deacetylase (PgdA/CDA1 family)
VTLTRRALLTGALAAAGLGAVGATGRDRPDRLAVAGGAPASPGPAGAGSAGAGPAGPAAAAGVPASWLEHGPRDRAQVALTLHGEGDPGLARRLLLLCEQEQAPVTVFAVGSWLAEVPGMAARVLDGGSELGNHTWTGSSSARQTPEQLLGEVVRTRDLLVRLTGHPGVAFRPVLVRHATPQVLLAAGRAGYRHVLTEDVDPADAAGAHPQAIRAAVARAARPGSVLSLHVTDRTLAALPGVLADLASAGLTPVPVGRLLAG